MERRSGQADTQSDSEQVKEPPGFALDESQVEKQHQYQMFPTPDEDRAAKIIMEYHD